MNKDLQNIKSLIESKTAAIEQKKSDLNLRVKKNKDAIEELEFEINKLNKDTDNEIDKYLELSRKLSIEKIERATLEEYAKRLKTDPAVDDDEYNKLCAKLIEICDAEVKTTSAAVLELLEKIINETDRAINHIGVTNYLLEVIQDELHLGIDRARDRNGAIIKAANAKEYKGVKYMQPIKADAEKLVKIIKGESTITSGKIW